MNYWVYENWTVVKGGRTTIHTGECSYCNEGRGMDKTKDPNRNGKWHGPFDGYEQAQKRAKKLRDEVRDCSICIK
jgi:hypothetical protein